MKETACLRINYQMAPVHMEPGSQREQEPEQSLDQKKNKHKVQDVN